MNQYKVTISSRINSTDTIEASTPQIAIARAYNRLWKACNPVMMIRDSKNFEMSVKVELMGKMVMVELKPEHRDNTGMWSDTPNSRCRQYVLESAYKAPDFDSNRWQLAKDKWLGGRFYPKN
jgi:hypothetical protein